MSWRPTALTTVGDGWDTIPITGSEHIKGTRVDVDGNTGLCFVNKAPFDTNGRRFAIVGALACWTDWSQTPEERASDKRKPPRVIPTKPGERHPDRDELPPIPIENWPTYQGVPQNPYRDVRLVYTVDAETAEEFTFNISSWRGRASVGELGAAIRNMRSVHPGAVPVVSVGTKLRRDRFAEKPGIAFIDIKWKLPKQAAAPEIIENNYEPARELSMVEEMGDELPF
jgi:hypothetical protein